MKRSQLHFCQKLPSIAQLKLQGHHDCVVFYDQKLLKFAFFKQWLKSFSQKVPVHAGESLKTLASFEKTLKVLQKMSITRDCIFLCVGGGSVGDFVGFLASTYHRGRGLIHIPTTWLAALDSAHGGKNGLNFLNIKNQIGTFYPATDIFLCRDILLQQSEKQTFDAMAEALKIAVINRPQLLKQQLRCSDFSASWLWKNLKLLIQAKYDVVQVDPYEKTGYRQILNLGHTMGHVFESAWKLSHGESVLLGFLFCLRFSRQRGYLSEFKMLQLSSLLLQIPTTRSYQENLQISDAKLVRLLNKDKKKTFDQKINFIFIHSEGKVFVEKLFVADLIDEVRRQRKEL